MSQELPTPQSTEPTQHTWKDRVNDAANEIGNRTRDLINEGNRRRLVIEREGRPMVSLPLTAAALIGAVAVIATPLLAVVGFVGALLARVQARVEPREPS